jgi:hypothetical protein
MLLQIKLKIYHPSVILSLINTQSPVKISKFRVRDEQNVHTSRPTIKNLEHSPVKFKIALKKFFHQHPFYSIKEYFEQGNPTRGSF